MFLPLIIMEQQISTENIVNVDPPTNNNFNHFLADSGRDTEEIRNYEKLSETFLNFVFIHFIKVLQSM